MLENNNYKMNFIKIYLSIITYNTLYAIINHTMYSIPKISSYPLGQFEVHHYNTNMENTIPDKSVQHVRGLITQIRKQQVIAGGVGYIPEKALFESYDVAKNHQDSKTAILGLDGVFVRAFVYENDSYVLPYRPTTLSETKLGDSKNFDRYLTNAGIKLNELTSGWTYYFQIVDPALAIGSNLSFSTPTIVYYGRQKMIDESGNYKYTLSNFKYEITDRELSSEVSTVKFDDIKSLINNTYEFPKIIYPVELTLDEATYMLDMDEAVLISNSNGLLKIINIGYDTRRTFRIPGQIGKSCANILQAVIKDNVSYVYQGKTIPTSNETKVADAIEFCKYIYPKHFHREIVMLHIILEHVRSKLPQMIMNDYANKRWRNNSRVEQICSQAYGYAKRMNNQNPVTIQQIHSNVNFLIEKEHYQSLIKLNEYYKIENLGF